MDLTPILYAALKATGTDPDAEEFSIEQVEKAQRALRAVDNQIARSLGHTTLAEVTISTPVRSASR